MSRVLEAEDVAVERKWKICVFNHSGAFSTISESICYVKRVELSWEVDCSCAIVSLAVMCSTTTAQMERRQLQVREKFPYIFSSQICQKKYEKNFFPSVYLNYGIRVTWRLNMPPITHIVISYRLFDSSSTVFLTFFWV